jgi:hypothetical protein
MLRDDAGPYDPNERYVESVDYELMPAPQAQKLCRRSEPGEALKGERHRGRGGGALKPLPLPVAAHPVFYGGFAFLPFMWAMNVWLFWPDFWHPRGDPVVKRCEPGLGRRASRGAGRPVHGLCAENQPPSRRVAGRRRRVACQLARQSHQSP